MVFMIDQDRGFKIEPFSSFHFVPRPPHMIN